MGKETEVMVFDPFHPTNARAQMTEMCCVEALTDGVRKTDARCPADSVFHSGSRLSLESLLMNNKIRVWLQSH